MSNWIWFGLVWLALLGGFIMGSAWTGYMKSFALVHDDDYDRQSVLAMKPRKPVRHISDDPNDYWSGNWDGDIR